MRDRSSSEQHITCHTTCHPSAAATSPMGDRDGQGKRPGSSAFFGSRIRSRICSLGAGFAPREHGQHEKRAPCLRQVSMRRGLVQRVAPPPAMPGSPLSLSCSSLSPSHSAVQQQRRARRAQRQAVLHALRQRRMRVAWGRAAWPPYTCRWWASAPLCTAPSWPPPP